MVRSKIQLPTCPRIGSIAGGDDGTSFEQTIYMYRKKLKSNINTNKSLKIYRIQIEDHTMIQNQQLIDCVNHDTSQIHSHTTLSYQTPFDRSTWSTISRRLESDLTYIFPSDSQARVYAVNVILSQLVYARYIIHMQYVCIILYVRGWVSFSEICTLYSETMTLISVYSSTHFHRKSCRR